MYQLNTIFVNDIALKRLKYYFKIENNYNMTIVLL